jgi:glycosyltransferase involved in cell wall biosynthesis
VPPLQPDRLADALESLLGDPGRREDLGARARRRVLERYDTAHCVDTYVAAYGRAVGYRERR